MMRHHLLLAGLVSIVLTLVPRTTEGVAVNRNKGTAAKPLDRKKIAVAGIGGYAGAQTFGFLQRAASLYGTGIGSVRGLGATADSSSRLNRVLSKHFVLAFADENYIKLTNLMESPEAIAKNLQGWDALILGTDVGLSERTVTAGTFEKTPNDRTLEIYWPSYGSLRSPDNEADARQTTLNNIIRGAQKAGVQHVCLVDDRGDGDDDVALKTLQETGVQYTCIRPSGPLTVRTDYTYRTGVINSLRIDPWNDANKSDSSSAEPMYREDLASLAVQSLLQLDWGQSRCLRVASQGAPPSDLLALGPKKRPDQEWCVNSFLLQEALAAVA
eukprot:scaffold381_cov178-Amphora_coffeaeformis.AAC.24